MPKKLTTIGKGYVKLGGETTWKKLGKLTDFTVTVPKIKYSVDDCLNLSGIQQHLNNFFESVLMNENLSLIPIYFKNLEWLGCSVLGIFHNDPDSYYIAIDISSCLSKDKDPKEIILHEIAHYKQTLQLGYSAHDEVFYTTEECLFNKYLKRRVK